MKALIAEFGYEGYGRFWALNERIAETPGAYIDISRRVNRLDLASELRLDGSGLDRFIAFLSDPEIGLININDNIITTDRVSELFSKITEERDYERKRKRGKTENGDFRPENGDFRPENGDFRPENDTDKIRVDEIRVDEIRQDSCGFEKPPVPATEPEKNLQETGLVIAKPHPPHKKRGLELSEEQSRLYTAAKACFDNGGTAAAQIYPDKTTAAMQMRCLKTLVVRCRAIAPGITAGFLLSVLEHFSLMTKGKYRGKMSFTPRCLITPWVWELVTGSLPEETDPALREEIRRVFR